MSSQTIKIDYRKSKLHVAIPVINEKEYIGRTIKALSNQTFQNFEVYACVNQPNDWWDDPDKIEICENNHRTIEFLRSVSAFPVHLTDKSTKGRGWVGKSRGVGWARKVLMDEIAKKARPQDLIVSLDADTIIEPLYFESIVENMTKYSHCIAMSVPYYHQLGDNLAVNKAILHYEIYMRYYAINLFRINSPYAFTALGSAMVVPIWVYSVVSGITPKSSGEDFYFLQKLAKYGKVLNWNDEKVYPSLRPSDRVEFGTGPAVIKGLKGDWSSYPIYDYRLFDNVAITNKLFKNLFKGEVQTPMSAFLQDQFNEENLWQPLRDNNKSEESFIRSCHEKVDALRILQYLKSSQRQTELSDDEMLKNFLYRFYPDEIMESVHNDVKYFSFEYSNLFSLNRIREFLVSIEDKYRLESVSKPSVF